MSTDSVSISYCAIVVFYGYESVSERTCSFIIIIIHITG